MDKRVICIALLCSSISKADTIITELGFGAFNTQGASIQQVKVIRFGAQDTSAYPFTTKTSLGAWFDSGRLGMSNSGFMTHQIGFSVRNYTLETSFLVGPALITSPDAAVGGIFQFNETLFIGLADKQDNSMGISYNHFSNAGLASPNAGKDFLSLEIKFPL